MAAGLRTIGFVLLVAAGMAILLGVVLLPAWTDALQAEYMRDCARADLTDAQDLLAAYTRKIYSIDTDAQSIRRYMLTVLGLEPGGKQVPLPWDDLSFEPLKITVTPSPKPDPPSGWPLALAQKAEDPPTRRGLLLLAAGAVICAVYLFDPGEKRKKLRAGGR